MKQWIIYKHTSMRSGKSYIGLTCVGIQRRWEQHVSDATNGSELHFHRAIRLYGIDNWEHTILADSIDTIEEANALEIYFIKLHDTFENGYNLTEGGGNTHMSNGPVKHKTPQLWIHKEYGLEKCTPWELCQKYSLAGAGIRNLINNPEVNKVFKGWQLYEEGKPILEEFKESIHTFYHDDYPSFTGTPTELSTKYGLIVGNIRKVVQGSRRHVKGWRITEQLSKKHLSTKRVYVYTLEGICIHTYDSSFQASACLGLKQKRVSGWLANKEYFVYNDMVYSYNQKLQYTKGGKK